MLNTFSTGGLPPVALEDRAKLFDRIVRDRRFRPESSNPAQGDAKPDCRGDDDSKLFVVRIIHTPRASLAGAARDNCGIGHKASTRMSPGKVVACDANSVGSANTYLVDIILANDISFTKPVTLQNVGGVTPDGKRVQRNELQSDASREYLESKKYDVLIGMDIIAAGDFAVSHRGGKTVFSYRIPPGMCIDFQDRFPPPKRIAPVQPPAADCACGSGQQYRSCCGASLTLI